MGVEAMAHHLVSCGFWSEETMLSNRVPRPTGFTSMDDKEKRPTPAETLVPIERRGALLDLAIQALVQGKITVGRWRELLKLEASTDWRLILEERHIELDAEYYLNVGA
jgi:predicted HTH domain antitoxin